MIQSETELEVADNSGAKKLLCIKVLGGSKKRYASVGEKIICSVKKSSPQSAIKKGEVILAVVVRTKKKIERSDGTILRFDGKEHKIIHSHHCVNFCVSKKDCNCSVIIFLLDNI